MKDISRKFKGEETEFGKEGVEESTARNIGTFYTGLGEVDEKGSDYSAIPKSRINYLDFKESVEESTARNIGTFYTGVRV